ncbi:MAG: hypothetical protein ABI647_06350 [Gemmatimonadota bacterium]
MGSSSKPHTRLAWRLLGLATLSGVLAALLSPSIDGRSPLGWSLPPILLAVPVLPMVIFFVELARYLRTLDEMQRLVHLQAMFIQFAGSCLVVMTYGLLARAALVPDLPMSRVWPFMWTGIFWLWAGGLMLVRRRYE